MFLSCSHIFLFVFFQATPRRMQEDLSCAGSFQGSNPGAHPKACIADRNTCTPAGTSMVQRPAEPQQARAKPAMPCICNGNNITRGPSHCSSIYLQGLADTAKLVDKAVKDDTNCTRRKHVREYMDWMGRLQLPRSMQTVTSDDLCV